MESNLRGYARRLTSATAVAIAALAALAAGAVLYVLGHQHGADIVWAGLVAGLLVPLCVSVARTLRRGDVGVDAIALIAMAGALALGEYLAGAVIALMLASGNALEERAGRRARRELTALISRAPRRAARVTGETLEDVPIDVVEPGDLLQVRGGEVVPADGILQDDEAVIDESALTGEALPVVYRRGQQVRSGTVSTGAARIRVTRRAAESAYAAVVRLARDAESQRAPFVRMADHYAALFLPLTAVVAAIAWAVSGDPVRALTVFVVATPCPLILAAPIALLSGVSRAARIGVVVKGGSVIERLGKTRTVILDKTGTLTLGIPELARIGSVNGLGESESLRLAASVDLASVHPFATALVREAQNRGLALQFPLDVVERPGDGVEGTIGGTVSQSGAERFCARPATAEPRRSRARLPRATRVRSSGSMGSSPRGSSSPTRRAKDRCSSPRGCGETASPRSRCLPVTGRPSPNASERCSGSTASTLSRRRRKSSQSSGRSSRHPVSRLS